MKVKCPEENSPGITMDAIVQNMQRVKPWLNRLEEKKVNDVKIVSMQFFFVGITGVLQVSPQNRSKNGV